MRITFRLTIQDEFAVKEIREHLRQTDPWADRTAVIRFALRETLERLSTNQRAR